ncbi:MAG: sugar ABC transporter permease [Clostridia bacterium]|nr:sugar ABC transporter permease [Clostridia bacterium]
MKQRKFRSLERQRAKWGWLFLAPWILGISVFFVWPMIQTVIYSFSNLTIGEQGGFDATFVGAENYLYFFTKDSFFLTNLTTSLVETIPSTLLIITFSTMIALLLREEFPMRGLARAVFFLPVIIASGPVISILETQVMMNGAAQAGAEATTHLFQAPDLTLVFADLGVPEKVLESITTIINEIFDLMWKSGVQILLMLSAVNNIPKSFYEVAMMEGATAWEKFWKITLPTLSPTLVVVVIYTLIDGFVDYDNVIIQTITNYSTVNNYTYSATVGVIYCVCVLAVVGIVSWIMSRIAFYSAE